MPSIGIEHGGARRWLAVGSLSFQPSEILKFGFIIYLAAWAGSVKEKIGSFKYGFLPLLVLFGICGGLLLKQPDTDTFLIIIMTGIAMFIAAGGRWRYVFMMLLVGLIGLSFLVYTRPYVKQRITTFLNPTADSLGASYQIQQSLIAIGSGGMFGKGFGQSVQKFTYLPEPVGDSIFAVAAEEFGFFGSVILVAIFLLFATRGLKIASRVPSAFGRLTVVGIVIMIASQAFVNIGAMLGVLPLSGITLPFVSHGGTSLFISLFEVGVVLSISKSQKQS
jgi:cell division protein FtsW